MSANALGVLSGLIPLAWIMQTGIMLGGLHAHQDRITEMGAHRQTESRERARQLPSEPSSQTESVSCRANNQVPVRELKLSGSIVTHLCGLS